MTRVRILMLGVWLLLNSVQLAAEPYGFGVIRTDRSGPMVQGYAPLLEHLQRQIGHDFDFIYTHSHEELIERMAAGEIHLAHMGPQPYLHLKERCPEAQAVALFLDEQGAQGYRCSLAVRQNSPIETIAQMEGAALALTQRYSTCGWLYPATVLHAAGLLLEESDYLFAGTHADAVMRLVLGEVQLAAARSDIVDRYTHMGIRHLIISDLYPNFVLVLSGQHLPAEHFTAIKEALLAIAPEAAQQRLGWHPLIRYGAVAVDEAIFEPVRQQMQRVGHLP